MGAALIVAIVVAIAIFEARDHPTAPRTSRTTPSPSATVQPSTTPTPTSALGMQVSDLSFVDTAHGWAIGFRCGASCALQLRMTADGGRTWSALPAPQAGAVTDLAGWHVLFADQRDGWIYGPRLFVTQDGGSTWSDSNLQTRTLSLVAGPSLWAVESQCPQPPCKLQLSVSSDRGKTWNPASTQPFMVGPNAQLLREPSNPDHAWVLSWGNNGSGFTSSLAATQDGGKTWHTLVRPCATETSVADVAAEAEDQLYIVCGGQPSAGAERKQFITSPDGGGHWNYRSDPPSGGYVQQLALGFVGTSAFNLWMATGRGPLYELPAFSGTWTTATTVDPGGSGVIRVLALGSQVVWAATSETVYRTTDGGAHWTSTS